MYIYTQENWIRHIFKNLGFLFPLADSHIPPIYPPLKKPSMNSPQHDMNEIIQYSQNLSYVNFKRITEIGVT